MFITLLLVINWITWLGWRLPSLHYKVTLFPFIVICGEILLRLYKYPVSHQNFICFSIQEFLPELVIPLTIEKSFSNAIFSSSIN